MFSAGNKPITTKIKSEKNISFMEPPVQQAAQTAHAQGHTVGI